jgi:YVTN family beta-propeller protein
LSRLTRYDTVIKSDFEFNALPGLFQPGGTVSSSTHQSPALKFKQFRRAGVVVVTGLLIATAGRYLTLAQSAPAASPALGSQGDGSYFLPNGWRLAPAGKHLKVGNLPLTVMQTPDSRYLIVTNDGLMRPTLSVVDVQTWAVTSTMPLDNAWNGLVWHPDGTRLYSAGGGQNNVQEFKYADGVITRSRTLALPGVSGETLAGGMAISRDGKTLYVTRVFAQTVSSIDLASGQVLKTRALPAEPYTCLLSADGKYLYVSLWGAAVVQVYFADSLEPLDELASGQHPSAMVLSQDGQRLFVACANSGTVWVYNTFSRQPIEQISTSLFPDAPATSTPNSVALSPDGRSMLVANADTNTVAVIDVSNASRSFVEGFIPTGWYPTSAIFSRDGKQVFILSGKGLVSAANPLGGGNESRLMGALSAVPTPDRTALAEHTRKVYSISPYSDATKMAPANVPIGSPLPRTVGGVSPIKYVFYIIRENRTYDQILGDMPQGNGDPALTLFGRNVTTNAHLVADNFVLFDNFYVDADVSFDGHAFSTAAYATDIIQKTWQSFYAGRGGIYLGEGEGFMRTPFGNISAPELGYIWDYAKRAGISVRSYGEFVTHLSRTPAGDVVAGESVPGLRGAVAPSFAGFDLEITDNKRVDNWLQEFNGFVANKNLPRLSIIHLGNDHTMGTKSGAPTPRAMIADNDLAMGRVIDTISNSPYWKESAVFVVEDDAQSGPDHVDSHRSVLLVASPFAKRSFVDHTLYTTSGVLRTMELILGLPPMSHYDAAATPLYNAFQSTPALTAYRAQMPAVSLDEKNLNTALGASISSSMNFSDADLTPEEPLNDVVWRSVKGPNVPMPPPRRSVFVHP